MVEAKFFMLNFEEEEVVVGFDLAGLVAAALE
jgi:hypothetical protein